MQSANSDGFEPGKMMLLSSKTNCPTHDPLPAMKLPEENSIRGEMIEPPSRNTLLLLTKTAFETVNTLLRRRDEKLEDPVWLFRKSCEMVVATARETNEPSNTSILTTEEALGTVMREFRKKKT